MNIGLIGAPGSGKTGLGYRLANKLTVYDPTCGCGERNVKVIDHYIPEIEERTQIALNPATTYLGNLYVALERYARERKARMEHDIVITCGTLIETAVYLAMQFTSLSSLGEEEKLVMAPRIDATLRMFSVLYSDIVNYDYAFYLPPQQDGNEDVKFIDQQLQAGLEGFKLMPVTPLIAPETQLEDALAALEVKDADAD